MTKKFGVNYTCAHCGKQTSAETAFGRWMRGHSDLTSESGIVRTDTDHTILRYKTHEQGRKFQLIVDVEVKEFGAEPDPSQADILGFKHQIANKTGVNINGARTRYTHKLKSRLTGRWVKVRYLGMHLLQFEKTNPCDSKWIKWDRREISIDQLVGLLALHLDPYNPTRSMSELLRDRHQQQESFSIFEFDEQKRATDPGHPKQQSVRVHTELQR